MLIANHLCLLHDAVRSVFYINAADQDQPLVAAFREYGYDIEIGEHVPVGYAAFQNAEKLGVVDFGNRSIVFGRNTMLDWMRPELPI